MLKVLVSTENDSELLTQHMTLSVVVNETLVILPLDLNLIPEMEPKGQTNTVSSSIDYSVFLTNSELSKTFGENTTLLESVATKISAMYIIESPTMSISIESSSWHLYLSKLFEVENLIQSGERKALLENYGFANISQLTGLSLNKRMNKGAGVYPSDDVIV